MNKTIPPRAAAKSTGWVLLWVILWVILIAAMLHVGSANAEPVGTVVKLSSPSQMLAKKSDGAIKVLIQNSTVDNGDYIETQTNTYAKIKFIDDSEITLGPNTQFKVDNFSYNKEKPNDDHSIFSMVKGTLRSITGALGHRSKDRYQLNTPAATIGIRGTDFKARFVRKEDATDKEAAGLTVDIAEGSISLTNEGGTQTFKAGEHGRAGSNQQAPEISPTSPENPEIPFNPVFGTSGSINCNVN